MTLSTVFIGKHLIYTLEIPICDREGYALCHVMPFPIRISSNQFAYIKPVNEYLAISTNNDSFIPLTKQQITACNNNKIQKICQFPETSPRKKTYTCEMSMYLNQKVIPNSCDVRHIILYHPTIMCANQR